MIQDSVALSAYWSHNGDFRDSQSSTRHRKRTNKAVKLTKAHEHYKWHSNASRVSLISLTMQCIDEDFRVQQVSLMMCFSNKNIQGHECGCNSKIVHIYFVTVREWGKNIEISGKKKAFDKIAVHYSAVLTSRAVSEMNILRLKAFFDIIKSRRKKAFCHLHFFPQLIWAFTKTPT